LRRRSIISAREAEAGGIPIYWADLPTRFVVGLAVRVGRCDESLANGGVTHLVEHLAVPTDVPGSVDVNGAVSDAVSFFWASGPEQLALDAKGRIAENLADPPLARLGPSTAELERQVDIVLIDSLIRRRRRRSSPSAPATACCGRHRSRRRSCWPSSKP
jgi:hypothetical protein